MNIIINDLNKAEQFTSLFQHIKLFSDHVNLTFNEEKMYLQTMDSARVSIFEITLPNTWFNSYSVTDKVTLGINANVLFKVLHSRDKEQLINMNCESGMENLLINFTNDNKNNFDKHFEIPLMELDVELMEIPNFESNTDIALPSSYFAGIISQLQIFGDTIEFICSEEKIELISSSVESGKMRVNIDVSELTEYSITEGDDMKISFSLTRLHNICMYHKISKEVEIILTNDFPMKIRYKLDLEDAEMVFYLAPKIGDD